MSEKELNIEYIEEKNEKAGISRRQFIALSAAGAAFAAVGCTNYPDKGNIINYNKKPDITTLGKAGYYATTCDACPIACGILVKTREGRPLKIDGNPEHPINQGKICARGQANILNLYDPERLKYPQINKNGTFEKISWQSAHETAIGALNDASQNNKEIAIITHTVVSPALNQLLSDFSRKYHSTRIYSYELFDNENSREAWKQCYGDTEPLNIDWSKCKTILAVEGDFIGNEGNFVENTRLFAKTRNFEDIKNFSRFYSIESNMSISGMMADHRIKLKPEDQIKVLHWLYSKIQNKLVNLTISNDLNITFGSNNDKKILDNLLIDLKNGDSAIYVGETLPVEAHILGLLINELIGANKLYRIDHSPLCFIPLSQNKDFEEFVQKMNSGKVGAVIHFDTNPVFHFPKSLGYKEALANVPFSATFTQELNETAGASKYILPINHNLESWGDAQTRYGILSSIQPLIHPLYDTIQKESILLTWMNTDSGTDSDLKFREYLFNFWQQDIYSKSQPAASFEQFRTALLHDGVFQSKSVRREIPKLNQEICNDLEQKLEKKKYDSSGFILILRNNYSIGDGRFANNGWLQELPHPVTKIVWDNYASISIKTAKELNLNLNDLIEIKIDNRSVNIPVMIQPGMADGVVSIELGYGRSICGDVGKDVGINANNLLSIDSGISKWIYSGAEINKIAGSCKLSTTQEFHAITDPNVLDFQFERKIILKGSVKEYIKNHEFLIYEKDKPPVSLYPNHEYSGVKWGMAIDMNLCTGCGVCVMSCNVENNCVVVGRESAGYGRSMHWIRTHRYYSGDIENPEVDLQMMLCQQCDNAPCENVCPVAATNHSPDGLNQMVYNRCVGTRYCSNNCPYKVRRFNFFNYRDHFHDGYYEKESLKLLNNPEVTVRSRGVMEKCTFCIQRIMEERENATREGRPIKASDVKTACQVACPTGAIKFGDLNDPDSDVSKLRDHNLGYHVLEALNVRPNIAYIARLRNTIEMREEI
jgi:Fe-S-cluster-containing dehydrogenase component/anaerobic selenocysteine-containing dehydrogenase